MRMFVGIVLGLIGLIGVLFIFAAVSGSPRQTAIVAEWLGQMIGVGLLAGLIFWLYRLFKPARPAILPTLKLYDAPLSDADEAPLETAYTRAARGHPNPKQAPVSQPTPSATAISYRIANVLYVLGCIAAVCAVTTGVALAVSVSGAREPELPAVALAIAFVAAGLAYGVGWTCRYVLTGRTGI
jgi:hypothetical protein